MSEDVYDLAHVDWCDLCEAPHPSCDPQYLVDLDHDECIECGIDTEPGEDFCPEHRPSR